MAHYKSNKNNTEKLAYLPVIFMIIIAVVFAFSKLLQDKPLLTSSDQASWTKEKVSKLAFRWLSARVLDTSNMHSLKSIPVNQWPTHVQDLHFFESEEQVHLFNYNTNGISYPNFGFDWQYLPLSNRYIITESLGFDQSSLPSCQIAPGMEIKFDNDSISNPVKNQNKTTNGLNAKIFSPKSDSVLLCHFHELPPDTSAIQFIQRIDEKQMYVRLRAVKNKAYNEMMTALENTIGIEKSFNLYLDLRGCKGDQMDEAALILSQFYTTKGTPLFILQGRKGKSQSFASTGKVFFDIDKITVILDENSGPAARLMAHVLGKTKRGSLAGAMADGKICRFEQISLADQSYIRIPVACYEPEINNSTANSYIKLLSPSELLTLKEEDKELWETAFSFYIEWITNNKNSISENQNVEMLKKQLFDHFNLTHESTTFSMEADEVGLRLYTYFLTFLSGKKQALSKSFIYHPAFQ